jgi:hypothetical protein
MIQVWQTFENEHFHITVITTPWCKAVVNNAAQSTCACFNKFAGQYSIWACTSRKDALWKILFANCGNGQFSINIKKNQAEHLDEAYVTRHYSEFMKLITKILNETDHFHIKTWALRKALSSTPDGHTLHLYRWVPTT